jgi:hypothetical protein
MDTSVVIKSMVDDILSDKSSEAVDKFNELMKFKVSSAIDDRKVEIAKNLYNQEPEENSSSEVNEVSPPGFEGTVKAMKKDKNIDNPYALAWYMKNKGYKSHKKADGTNKE